MVKAQFLDSLNNQNYETVDQPFTKGHIFESSEPTANRHSATAVSSNGGGHGDGTSAKDKLSIVTQRAEIKSKRSRINNDLSLKYKERIAGFLES